MEARRTFETGARSSKQIWLAFAAVLTVLVLGIAGAFLAKSLSSSASASPSVSTPVHISGGPTHRGRIAPKLLDGNAEQAPSSAAADRRYR
jgi:flagellar basal body-associated protein FliL